VVRAIWLLLVVGCSSSPKPPQGGWAPLPPEGAAAAPPDAALAPEIATVATTSLGTFEETPTFPATGPACMPAGDYAVTFDLTAARFEARGMDPDFCAKMGAVVPSDQLKQMKLSFEAGKLLVDWPDRKNVISVKNCSFALQGPPFAAHIAFTDGAGTGLATYTLGSPNHPDEVCSVRDAKFTIAKKPT
jgi:hypothetical protein